MPTRLATATIVLAWSWVVLLVLMGLAADASESVWGVAVADGLRFAETGYVPFDLAVLPSRPLLLATYVVACLWLARSRRFADVNGRAGRRALAPAWAWFVWWLPVVCLWMPCRMVGEVCRASTGRSAGWLLAPWWTCWLAMWWLLWTVQGWLGGPVGRGVLDDSVLVAAEGYIAASGLAFVGCLCWTAVVVKVRRGQRVLAARG